VVYVINPTPFGPTAPSSASCAAVAEKQRSEIENKDSEFPEGSNRRRCMMGIQF
jgi:hypothetical protein